MLRFSFSMTILISLFAHQSGLANETPSKKTVVAPMETTTVIPLTNMLVGEKKIWLPGEIKARQGKIKFILNNTLAEPHGFQIPGVMKVGVVVPANESLEVPVTLPKKQKYELKCHMHPAHVSAYIEAY